MPGLRADGLVGQYSQCDGKHGESGLQEIRHVLQNTHLQAQGIGDGYSQQYEQDINEALSHLTGRLGTTVSLV